MLIMAFGVNLVFYVGHVTLLLHSMHFRRTVLFKLGPGGFIRSEREASLSSPSPPSLRLVMVTE